MKRILVLVTFMLMIPVAAAYADTVSLGSDADTYLRDDVARGDLTFMDIRGGGVDFAGYLRFDFSSLGAIDISDASLKLTVSGGASRNDTLVDGRFGLYGLNDITGNTSQSWDEVTLTETGTNPVGSEWNGVVPMDLTGGRVTDLDMATVPGIVETLSASSPDPGTTITITGPPLVAFLQDRADAGGLVTFILANNDATDRGYGLATKENTTADYPPVLDLTYTPTRHAWGPVPDNGATVGTDLDTLAWINPEPLNPPGTITCDVYFGTTEPNALYVNYGLDKIADDIAVTNVAIPAGYLPLTSLQTYYWVVDCYDATGEGDLPGLFWSFLASSTPEFIIDPEDQAELEGQSAVFSAVFTSNTAPSAGWPKWYKVGSPDVEVLASDPDVTIEIDYNAIAEEYTSTLTIANLIATDDGSYYCEAKNDGGPSVSESAKLIIKRLIAHWKFDETLNDETTVYNGTNGTEGYDTLTYAVGKVNQAVIFDTDPNDYVDLPDGFDDFSAGMSISVWAKPSAVTTWARFIDFGNGAPANNILFTRIGDTDDLRFDTAYGVVDTIGIITLDVWQMLVVTMNEAGDVIVYKDGFQVNTGSIGIPDIITRTSNFIGESNWEADELYNGMMDDMRIYNYAITADDVADLYSAVEGDYCRFPPIYDFTDDCKVTVDDIAYLAGYWLDCGYYPDCEL